jgi:type VI secretion system Hcp family effector
LSQTALNKAYIRFEGESHGLIQGSSTDSGFQDWSSLISFSESIVSPTDPTSGLPSGAIRPSDFTVTKPVDRASVPLLAVFTDNEELQEVTVELRRTIQSGATQTYLRYTLLDARLTGRRISGNVPGGSTEVLTIAYQRMIIEWPLDGLVEEFERPQLF